MFTILGPCFTVQNVSMRARIHVRTFITRLFERNDMQTDISIYYE